MLSSLLGRVVYAVIVGIVVFLVALLILTLTSLPVSPWAELLGVLAAILVFVQGHRF